MNGIDGINPIRFWGNPNAIILFILCIPVKTPLDFASQIFLFRLFPVNSKKARKLTAQKITTVALTLSRLKT